MPVVVTCPTCQRKARVPSASVGKRVKCRRCGTTFPAVTADATPPPIRRTTGVADEPDVPALPASPEDDARRVTRTGVGLLTASQALLAVGTALKLLLLLIQLLTSDTGAKSSLYESLTEFLMIASTLALLGGIIAATIGAVFCTVTPGAISVRAAAATVLVLSLLYAIQAPTGSLRDLISGTANTGRGNPRTPDAPATNLAGLMLLLGLTPEAYEAARQAMLAVYARVQARRLGDRAAAGLAGLIAIAYPVAVVGLILLGVVVNVFSGKPHPTFDQVLSVLVLLTKTVLIALGAFVLLRVWMRLGVVRAG
jgi:hypothetical protein